MDVLSSLRHVTQRKLEKLEENRASFEGRKASVLANVAKEAEPEKKVRALLEELENLGIQSRPSVRTSVKNIERFLDQSRHDPSVSSPLLQEWQADLEHELEVHGTKYDYASLFGQLVTEWIDNKDGGTAKLVASHGGEISASSDAAASFEQIGRKEMHEQREQWEAYAFRKVRTDEAAIEQYLHDLFGSARKAKKLTKTPLQNLREGIKNFDKQSLRLHGGSVAQCIKGVLKSDLFTGKKRETLVDLVDRRDVLKEIADILNMDLESLEAWSWKPSPVPLHMRRQLNGKYRVFMDEEIHQALLLYFVGQKWAVHLKSCFTSFYRSGAWIESPYRSMGKRDRQRRAYFLGTPSPSDDSVRDTRRLKYHSDYFMSQLPTYFEEEARDYSSGDAEVPDKDGVASAGAEDLAKSPLAVKQSLLHLVTTELLLNLKLYGRFTILQSDFKWFGPSLPHATIFAVLKFFGVPDKWMALFKKFLEAPVVFAQDGPDAQAQMRTCGIPMSHVLSDALGEAVLFCLDFAVNQRTKGAVLYRFHDDLWIWGQESTCVEAWRALNDFARVMGLELNEDKTGTVQVTDDPSNARALTSSLPRGRVGWGFLRLDPSTGRWIIDRKEVDEHIHELRRQLAACHGVLAWVQAWNSYVTRFFSVNFGQAANCMGRQHVDMVIETLEHVQRKVFEDGTAGRAGNVTERLRGMIRERFQVADIPDGFFYFPVELGGLELRNPFVQLFAIREKSFRNPIERIERAFEEEEERYKLAKARFDKGEHRSGQQQYHGSKSEMGIGDDDDEFMSLEEYTRFREETSDPLEKAYENLMEVPPEDRLEASPRVSRALQSMQWSESASPGFDIRWDKMQPYWKWVVELHGGPIIDKFGGLRMGDKALLPIGLVGLLRGEKVRWQG